jgi:hypothetical protein
MFLLAIVLLAPGVVVRLPTPRELVRAARLDENELERVAARLGAVRLLDVAQKGKRDERAAALKALPVVHDGWAVLPELARIASDADADIGASAAVAARRIAEGLGPDTVETEEIPIDVPADAAKALLAQAARTSTAPSTRAMLIAATAALRGVTRIDEAGLVKLLGDPDVEVRRAVAEGLAGSSSGDAQLTQVLAKDAAVPVAAAAGAALCRDVPLASSGPVEKASALARPKATALAEARAAKLPPAARERLRALAVDENVSLADRLDLLPCLRVAATPDDQRILDQLATKKAPESLRRRARALGGKG